jgi:hypothetical protein
VNRGHIEDTWFVDESISANSAPVARGGNATVSDHGSKTLAIIALISSCVALGAVSMYVILQAQIIDSKIAAGAAKAEATSWAAKTDARVALDKVEDVRTKLAEKGIQIGPLDGH